MLSVRADFGYPVEYHPKHREYDANLAGGCAFEVGIYPIALNRLFHKQEPISRYKLQHWAPNGVEDPKRFWTPPLIGHWVIYPAELFHRPGILKSQDERIIVAADLGWDV